MFFLIEFDEEKIKEDGIVNLPFKEESWFGYYVKKWQFIDIDDETNEICTYEDLLEEWVERPNFSQQK